MDRKRTKISLELKKKIIDAAEKGLKNNELVKQFGLDPSTISRIVKSKEKVLTAIENGGSSKKAKIKKESQFFVILVIFNNNKHI